MSEISTLRHDSVLNRHLSSLRALLANVKQRQDSIHAAAREGLPVVISDVGGVGYLLSSAVACKGGRGAGS